VRRGDRLSGDDRPAAGTTPTNLLQHRPMATAADRVKAGDRIVIEARPGWHLINWRELRESRDLLYFLVWKEIRVLYNQTILGFSWAILRPLLSMLIFTVVFGRLAKMPSDGVPYPLFSFAALVPWTFFSSAMVDSSTSLVTNVTMLTKVYFPRLVIPLTPVLAKLVDFGIAFVLLLAMMAWFRVVPGRGIVMLPVLILLMVLTAAGVGMLLSALAIQYRDIKHAIPFLSQILMYAAPVVWPASLVPARYRLVYGLFPMAGVIEGIRSALLRTTPMPWDLISMGAISAVGLALIGALYFRRMERIFADVA
jgi:homopolymeric O-antigen transport system permease protein